MSELLPCPFCGESPKKDYSTRIGCWSIFCNNDDCDAGCEVSARDEHSIIEVWNSRRSPPTTDSKHVAWIAFSDNGKVRFWTDDAGRAEREQSRGMTIRGFTVTDLVGRIAHLAGGTPSPEARP